jgi:cyclin-dependent kinase-like
MDNYEHIRTIGEGTYGIVVKARHKASGQIVAIKKFKDSDDDEQVRKTALREVRILKQLKHPNVVRLIEVFRRRGRIYLVFEYVEKTLLEDLEAHPGGIASLTLKKYIYQLLRALEYIHKHNIVHRDIKPENLLISKQGVLKLCDFGFARTLSRPGAKYTDYVATRWYRAPELLVGDTSYGQPVDIWAVGCMLSELITGMPLFPGDSDIDQLYHVMRCFGNLTPAHIHAFASNPLYTGVKTPTVQHFKPLEDRFPHMDHAVIDIMKRSMRYDPNERDTAGALLQHVYFAGFSEQFDEELRQCVHADDRMNGFAPARSSRSTSRRRAKHKSNKKHHASQNTSSTSNSNKASIISLSLDGSHERTPNKSPSHTQKKSSKHSKKHRRKKDHHKKDSKPSTYDDRAPTAKRERGRKRNNNSPTPAKQSNMSSITLEDDIRPRTPQAPRLVALPHLGQVDENSTRDASVPGTPTREQIPAPTWRADPSQSRLSDRVGSDSNTTGSLADDTHSKSKSNQHTASTTSLASTLPFMMDAKREENKIQSSFATSSTTPWKSSTYNMSNSNTWQRSGSRSQSRSSYVTQPFPSHLVNKSKIRTHGVSHHTVGMDSPAQSQRHRQLPGYLHHVKPSHHHRSHKTSQKQLQPLQAAAANDQYAHNTSNSNNNGSNAIASGNASGNSNGNSSNSNNGGRHRVLKGGGYNRFAYNASPAPNNNGQDFRGLSVVAHKPQ